MGTSGVQKPISFDTVIKDPFKTLDMKLGFGADYKLNNGVLWRALYNSA